MPEQETYSATDEKQLGRIALLWERLSLDEQARFRAHIEGREQIQYARTVPMGKAAKMIGVSLPRFKESVRSGLLKPIDGNGFFQRGQSYRFNLDDLQGLEVQPKVVKKPLFVLPDIDFNKYGDFNYSAFIQALWGQGLKPEITNRMTEDIDTAIKEIQEHEQFVIQLRFRGCTLRAIAVMIERTPERIRQIEGYALRRLRRNKVMQGIREQ